MDWSFAKHIWSPCCKFKLGNQKEIVTVHSAPIADLSPALADVLNNKPGYIDWPEVTKETFTRLCEFAYLNDYTPPASREIESRRSEAVHESEAEAKNDVPAPEPEPEPELEPELKSKSEPDPEPEDAPEIWPEPETLESDRWGTPSMSFSSYKKNKKNRKKKGTLDPMQDIVPDPPKPTATWWQQISPHQKENVRDDYTNGVWPSEPDNHEPVLPVTERTIRYSELRNMFSQLTYTPKRQIHQFQPKPNAKPTEDFTPVFLGHAELYILAHGYDIKDLRELILLKLQQTLQDFIVYETSVASILDFVRFAYKRKSKTGEMKGLRRLVTVYVVSILGQIGDREEFQSLLAEGGDFVVDFWRTIWTGF
ncbi:hypothetical protein TSTA_057580 [Talaromyces stipitatus ATCC 10500]|uniref:BTB domain-containing protein n=1 Tax=Talaromyces stipitatus (strain ATCC 10500 / CBS 375.48 / QM 6759 / NRRL 1006) TaxID=441959 RepID=B8MRT4_TALSN|nr:uncharacterized protein TSTA_057580 [Talaromyces stipitatus ATCC 10500]EED13268.1 hypothetical protein TSTA_057580 [Talaromyces stipitatus ATCC 10500]